MSPKASRSHHEPDHEPDGEPEALGLPPGHVPMRRPVAPRPAPHKPFPLWVKAVGFVVLLAATVGVVVYLAQPDDPRDSAQGTANLAAAALSDGDRSAFASYTCYPDDVTLPDGWTRLGTTTVLAVSDEHDDVATATLVIGNPADTDLVLLMRNEDDAGWCVVTPSLCPRADTAPATPSPLDLCADRPGRP
ncbi:hypothetical protein [Actinophytocola sp. NPDC049390]|uniref:hypothetical protein n=1 Tax=Actinophytocola sp. NPDC049390 TaxID=3363894 RepID=UPI0037A48A35